MWSQYLTSVAWQCGWAWLLQQGQLVMVRLLELCVSRLHLQLLLWVEAVGVPGMQWDVMWCDVERVTHLQSDQGGGCDV